MVPITYITCRQSGWLYFAVCNPDSWFYNISLHLSLCVSAFMSLWVGLSLWACHLWTGLSAAFCIFVSLPSFYTVIPSLTSWLSFVSVLASFSHCCLSCPFPRHGPPRLIFCLFLWLSCISPPPNSTEPAVVSNQNNIFKNSVNITPTNSEGLLVGYSCIQVYIVSWWRCIRSAGEPNMAIPSKFDAFIHSH